MSPETQTREIDVRGLLRVRLVEAMPSDIKAVEQQLGLPSTEVHGETSPPAGITVRYRQQLAGRDGRGRRIGSRDVLWTDAGFAIRTGSGRERWVHVPFADIGAPMVLECERGAGRIPLLVPLLNLSLLARDVVPLHASAFILRGVGTAAGGWSQGGKTEALLAAMADGATMVADEWAYVTGEGHLFGLPIRVRLEPRHFREGWVSTAAVGAAQRGRVHRTVLLDRGLQLPSRLTGRSSAGRVIARGVSVVSRRNNVNIAPADLFGVEACAPSLELERFYWLVPLDGQASGRRSVTIAPADAAEVARRMAVAHVHHRLEFLDAYWRFRYAFPNELSRVVEEMEARELVLLEAALARVPTYRMEHAADASPAALREALRSGSET